MSVGSGYYFPNMWNDDDTQIQLYREMQECHGISINIIDYFQGFNQDRRIISDILFFLRDVEGLMKRYTDKYTNMVSWPCYGSQKKMHGDLIFLEHQIKIVDENVGKDASVMWCISNRCVPQSTVLYLAVHEINITKEYVLGEYISELEFEKLTQLLRAIYSVKCVYKTWKNIFLHSINYR